MTAKQLDPLAQLRAEFAAAGNPADGEQQQRYHKSPLPFYGLKAADQVRICRSQFPPRAISRATHLPLMQALWHGEYFDERVAALWLMERLARSLTPQDLPWLHTMTRECTGWALTDYLATRTLSALALRYGGQAYPALAAWLEDDWLWTRRAALLVHVMPARKAQLDPAWAWPAFESRLHEREFFIRKAVGWVLRECCKHYSNDVHAFLLRVGERASGLTRREGARNLPPELRRPILGK